MATSDRAAKTKYCGIILRFRPIVSTILVISEATIYPAQTFAQDGGATIATTMPHLYPNKKKLRRYHSDAIMLLDLDHA